MRLFVFVIAAIAVTFFIGRGEARSRFRPQKDDGTYSKGEHKDFDKYYAMIDLDSDGYVSCFELEAVLLEALPFSGEGPIIEVIERLMDIDENGIVDKEEFLHLLRHAEANKKVREWEAALNKAHGLAEWYGVTLPSNLEDAAQTVTLLDAIVEIAIEKGANLDYTPSHRLIRSSKIHRTLKKHDEKSSNETRQEKSEKAAPEGEEVIEIDGIEFTTTKKEAAEEVVEEIVADSEGEESTAREKGSGKPEETETVAERVARVLEMKKKAQETKEGHSGDESHFGGRWRREEDAMGPKGRHLHDFEHIQRIKEEIRRREEAERGEEERTKAEEVRSKYRQAMEGPVDVEIEDLDLPTDEDLRKYVHGEKIHDYHYDEEEIPHIPIAKVREYIEAYGEDALRPKTESWEEAFSDAGLHSHPLLGHIHYDLAERGLKDILDLFDNNKDGFVVPHEIRLAINKANLKVSDAVTEGLLQAKAKAREWEAEAGIHSKEEAARAEAEKEKRRQQRERMAKERERRKIIRQQRRESMKAKEKKGEASKKAQEAFESLKRGEL